MIRIVDKACSLYPMVVSTLFVDDLASDVTAPAKHVVQQLGGFIETIADFVKKMRLLITIIVDLFLLSACKQTLQHIVMWVCV